MSLRLEYIYQGHWWWGAGLAPFTLPIQCGINALILCLTACLKVTEEEREDSFAAVLHGKVSVILSVLPTLRHIAAYRTAFVPGSRDRWLPLLNGGDCVMGFRAKHLNSPCLFLFPLLCCCSYCLWQPVLKKITTTVSPLEWDFSELTPRTQPPSPLGRVCSLLMVTI